MKFPSISVKFILNLLDLNAYITILLGYSAAVIKITIIIAI